MKTLARVNASVLHRPLIKTLLAFFGGAVQTLSRARFSRNIPGGVLWMGAASTRKAMGPR
jgi:hypothetical protein